VVSTGSTDVRSGSTDVRSGSTDVRSGSTDVRSGSTDVRSGSADPGTPTGGAPEWRRPSVRCYFSVMTVRGNWIRLTKTPLSKILADAWDRRAAPALKLDPVDTRTFQRDHVAVAFLFAWPQPLVTCRPTS